ncbi:MAG: hypothetical protein CRN43_20565 [Candidatus Nephrothrix sp. EaCA]|nr:MAG: hypothetical protein CRN43_20565 [Candidatus Nephrothrix sp. EaCA]
MARAQGNSFAGHGRKISGARVFFAPFFSPVHTLPELPEPPMRLMIGLPLALIFGKRRAL